MKLWNICKYFVLNQRFGACNGLSKSRDFRKWGFVKSYCFKKNLSNDGSPSRELYAASWWTLWEMLSACTWIMCITTPILLVHMARDVIRRVPGSIKAAPAHQIVLSTEPFVCWLCVKHHPGESSSALRIYWYIQLSHASLLFMLLCVESLAWHVHTECTVE